uniref:RNA helicase n=1 Tax=Sphenodon punctatus TaxID=8508 RepID=A0A8D0G950_SPHPU
MGQDFPRSQTLNVLVVKARHIHSRNSKILLSCRPQNLIAQSQSGTGKTAAFVLAMLNRINPQEKFPQCLCLAPTYELALQNGRVVEKMGQFCVNIGVAYAIRGNRIPRGTTIEEQIVIGTPGTVLDWCFKLRLLKLKNIHVFVLDEADVMIDTQGFADQSIRIQRKAKWLSLELIRDGHQVSLLSGELTVDQRASVIQRFRDGKEKVLITTNVCARGTDFSP